MLPNRSKVRPTKTQATILSYEKTYRQLKKRCAIFYDTDNNSINPDLVNSWFMIIGDEFSQSTWRQYKAAIMQAYENDISNYSHEHAILEKKSSRALQVHSKRTSGKKLKCVIPEAWRLLASKLNARARGGYRYSEGLLNILQASLATGLRPTEWFRCRIAIHAIDGRKILEVQNAKHSNGRANGKFRAIYLDKLPPDDFRAVTSAVMFCDTDEDKALSLLVSLRNELYRAKLALKKDNVMLCQNVAMYSFRHQCIADAKCTFSSGSSTAALVGHNSIHTAWRHYAKRKNSNRKLNVSPTQESIDAVCNLGMVCTTSFPANKNDHNVVK